MMEKLLRRAATDNAVDELVDQLVENMRYTDQSVVYPNTDNCKPDDGVSPDLFTEAYIGLGKDSERTAINQYMTQAQMFPTVAQTLMGIGITEMKHMDHLGDLIVTLGGKVDRNWNNSKVVYGKDAVTALHEAIVSEMAAIYSYEQLIKKLEIIKTPTGEICTQLIGKLLADERYHLTLLIGEQNKLNNNEN